MKLYYAPSTIASATAITLHEAGLAFEPVRVDFKSGEQTSDAYRAINPKARVPALVTEHGTLTETGALLEYIADIAPQAGLRPLDALAVARMREAMCYVASTMHVNHAHKLRGHRWANDDSSLKDMTAKVPETMTASARHVEDHILRGPFVMGENLTLADPWLFTACNWLPGDGVEMAGFPKISDFAETMRARPSVARVIADGML